MTDEGKQQLLQLALDSEPFDRHNHVKIVDVDDGWAQVEVEIHPETLNRWGIPHGGILFTLSDVACGMAILTVRTEACVTVNGTIDCISAGPTSGRLIATGRVRKVGGKMAFCDSEIHDDAGRLITTGHTVMYFTGRQLL